MKQQGVFTVTIQKKDQVVNRVLNEDSFTVGRSVDCLVQLNDSSISRVHVEVIRRDGQVWIEDKNSSNGTFINGTKITGGTFINVIANDKIQIGKSDYILSIELIVEEEQSPEEILKAVAAAGQLEDASRTHEVHHESVRIPIPEIHQSDSDHAVNEARKRAAQVIYEGEIQAEKKVQAIYKKAQEAQAEAEAQSKKKIADARRESEAFLEQSQSQGQDLLREARTFAQQIRDEVHAYVDELRVKAQEEADAILLESRKKSEQLRAELVAESREQVEKESANLIKKSKEEASEILREAEEDAQKFYKEIADHKTELIELQKKLAGAQVSAREAEENTKKLRDQENQAKAELSEFEGKAKTDISQLQANIAANTKEAGLLADEVKIKQKKVEELKGLIANRTMELKAVDDNKAQFDRELELKRQQIKDRLEKEEHNFMKASEERMNEMNNDLKKRVEKMEMDLLTELMHKREMLQKEVFNQVEKVCRPRMDASDWSQTISDVQKAIQASFESKLIDISQSSIPGDGKATDLSKKRRNDKWRWAYSGMAAGLALMFAIQTGYKIVVEDQTPIRTRTLAEAQKRQEDLARRKFNPPQVLEPKDTYVDSVIYTKSFAKNYLDPEFQKKLYKAASAYLLKTWRLEEEKSIEVLAAAGALVQELDVKKETIHPDFVKDSIAKMRKIEAQTTQRMKDILGSEVRLESYRTFEKKFYSQEAQKQ